MSSYITPSHCLQKSQQTEDERFYTRCRAAYVAVFKSSLANIQSKEQLCIVLQQAGLNPSLKTLGAYWTPGTVKLNFDDFCEILKKEKQIDQTEVLKAFRKMDPDGSGYISHGDLYRVLTSTGEKMSPEEVNSIFSIMEINRDGKLDYNEFCRLLVFVTEECQTTDLQRLEADGRQKRQNFGNDSESSPQRPATQSGPVASESSPQRPATQPGPVASESSPQRPAIQPGPVISETSLQRPATQPVPVASESSLQRPATQPGPVASESSLQRPATQPGPVASESSLQRPATQPGPVASESSLQRPATQPGPVASESSLQRPATQPGPVASESSLQRPSTQPGPAASESTLKTELDTTPRKENRSPAWPSSARSRRSSTSGAGGTRSSKLLEPRSLQDWHHISLKGCFHLEDNGEIVSLQYRLHLAQPTAVFLTVQPMNLCPVDDKPSSWMNVDTALFLVNEGFNVVCCTELHDKEKFGWKGELNAGTYYIIPFTTGCRLRKSRQPVTKAAQLVYRTETGELALTKEFRAALSDIFEVIDLDGNGLLSLEEYNFFEQRSSGEKCDGDAWAVCKENFDTRKNQLTRQGFMELSLMEANDREGDPSDLWVTLESMGYNRALEMVEACPFVVNVYAEASKPTMQPVSLESPGRALHAAVCESVIAKGQARPLKSHSDVLVHTYRSEARISSVIDNKSAEKVTVYVNNEQSKNCCGSRGLSMFAVEVPPRSKVVCQHIVPVNEKQEWIYSCVESILT
ncbi:EF-hand calcium-binding domain-containing protein 7 isoform X1 [Brienomyrus brachyistius]|uniref:EF-hand calcium-binding domain-containing protein 7 isoform X1 n=1 Tax=Brienomyrus brachyistius TaxID=42636 RepID=UPI0020B23385|nr:EF-hand calcium-binding domain-containing protein 7 isoform X1 [Brienomyrus brachyistius]